VRLFDVAHEFPDDIDVLLVSPGGKNLILMSDVGGDTEVDNLTLSFDDDAATRIPDQGPLVGGLVKPTNVDDGSADDFPPPAPAPSASQRLSKFNGSNPVGRWRLFIVDDKANDVGRLDGWVLDLEGIGSYHSPNQSSFAIPAADTSGPAGLYPVRVEVPSDAIQNAGAVTVLFGSRQGISTQRSQFIHQSSTAEVENKAEGNDNVGEVM